jgi:hypothetical protein
MAPITPTMVPAYQCSLFPFTTMDNLEEYVPLAPAMQHLMDDLAPNQKSLLDQKNPKQ